MSEYFSSRYEGESELRYTEDGARILGRAVLPSGKKVDVVSYVKNKDDENQSSSCGHGMPLACCPKCGHDRVQPTGWSEAGSTHWHVSLRCPDCEDRRAAIFGQDELNEFDVALDEGTRSVVSDLDLLARANMADYVDSFTQALNKGCIMPQDF
jgi:hypothetical protein